MVKVQIGSSVLPLEQADPNWVNDQLRRQGQGGRPVCVRVTVDVRPDINMQYSTPICPSGGGIQRPLSGREQMILDLWRKHHLDKPEIHPGDLIGFLRQLDKIIG
jgi:hypothetical protein